MAEVSWSSVREQFPVAGERTYLNTATYGPGPRSVIERVEQAVRSWSLGDADWRAWEEDAERSRELFAHLVGTAAENVALLPVVSLAAGLVAESLSPERGANIVVGEEEFRSNLFPFLIQERRGFEIRAVPFRGGGPRAEDVALAVDGGTALVALSDVQSATGYRLDLPAVAGICREHGARLFLDGTQAVGALRTDVGFVDYLAVSGYKWLLAPRGASFLVVAPERREELVPTYAGWRTPGDPHRSYYGGPLDLAPDASRFDASLAWMAWVGMRPALELLCELGPQAIEARDLSLAARFREGLGELGLEPLVGGEAISQIVSLAVPDPERVRAALEAENVVAAVRDRFLRVAFHFFNDEGDVDRALAVL